MASLVPLAFQQHPQLNVPLVGHDKRVKPLLKWAGGKRQLANLIETHLPSNWDKGTYFEPFIGGAAMFLHLKPGKSVISDVNTRLINFYQVVATEPTKLIREVSSISEGFNSVLAEEKRSYYLSLRTELNKRHLEATRQAALLYSVNKLCFNGLYRENSQGDFNVPFGNKALFPDFSAKDFFQVSEVLQGAKIVHGDFEFALSTANSGDFVYLDPPYIPLDATSSFTAYSASGFNVEDQRRLAKSVLELEENGVKVLLSNSDTSLTREIYKGLKFVSISAPRSVSAKSSGRGKVQELLIKNY